MCVVLGIWALSAPLLYIWVMRLPGPEYAPWQQIAIAVLCGPVIWYALAVMFVFLKAKKL